VGELNNFIPASYADEIEHTLSSSMFPWYWNEASIVYEYKGTVDTPFSRKDYQFTHRFYADNEAVSDYFMLIKPLVLFFESATGIKVKRLVRAKANLTTRINVSDSEMLEAVHVDAYHCDTQHISMVYYVCDSDGDTVVMDDNYNIVASKSPAKGTAFYFSSFDKHRPTPPVEYKRRIIINIVMEIE